MRDDDAMAPWRSLLLTHAAAVRAVERDLARAGHIPLTWYDVLLELNAAPGRRLRMQELADRVVLSRSRVSRVVAELERAGLVERHHDPADARAVLASLTAEGRGRLRAAAPAYRAAVEKRFSAHLDERERRTLARLLDKVRSATE
jgi:DNA-binding MarR family transcriptional regulator